VGVGAAVPFTLTFNLNEGVVGSFVAIVIVPVFVPVAAGVPVTVNVEEVPAAIGLAGVRVPTANPVAPVIELTVNGIFPVFLIVKVKAVAAVPTTEDPTDIAGLLFVVIAVVPFNTCKAGLVPVTDIFTIKEGVVGSFVTMVTVPVLVPVIAGVPVTVKVADAPAAIGLGELRVPITKPVEPVTEVTVNGELPAFLIVNVNALAAVPVVELPTEIAGELFAVTGVVAFNTCNAGAVPVTLTLTTNEGVVGSFVTMVTVPVLVPVTAGVPVTVKLEVAPAAIGLGELRVPIAKPVEPVTEVTVSGAVPAFLIVNVNAVAAVPVAELPTEIAGELFVVTAVVPFNTCRAGTVPVTLTFNLNEGVVGSFVTMVMVPVFVPEAAGVPVTVKVTVEPAATEPGVVIALTTNPAEPVTDVTVKADVPVLLIENEVYELAADPTTADPTEMAGLLLVVTGVVTFNTLNVGVVPVTVTFSLNEGVVGSFVTMVMVPVFVPVAAGVPVTVNVADAPAAIGLASVPTAKPVEPVTDVTVSGAVPVFLTVKVNAVAAEPTTAVPTEMAGVLLVVIAVVPFNTWIEGTVPVTLTFTTNEGVAGSFVAMVIVPVFVPVTAGVPVTVNVAVAPAAIGLAGVSVPTANPVEPVTDVTVSGAFPVFLTVNVTAAAAVPVTAEPTDMAGVLLVAIAVVPFNTLITGALAVSDK